jgi:hypothetical protein
VRAIAVIVMAVALSALGAPVRAEQRVAVTDTPELIAAVHRVALLGADSGAVVLDLAPGDYHLEPQPYLDPTCGNCEDPARGAPATLGLRIAGGRLTLRGPGADQVRIHTHAGYGLLFEDCRDCRLEGVTVTGGERDTAGLATDAAVVVRRSRLILERCRLADNIGDSAVVARTVVGIMGLCGREGSEITARDCEILRNSWDGIALYRDASAHIEDCLIDGVDRGARGPACGGRGVAIGVTWNARARIEGNRVTRYWKGIGIFVDAEAVVRENVVEDMLTWGISLWDAEKGTPFGEITWNAVHRTGACGISVTRGLPGGRDSSLVRFNAITHTGANPKYDSGEPYCRQCAVAADAQNPDIRIEDNACCENREPGDAPGANDIGRDEFGRAIELLLEGLGRRPRARESDFFQEFAPASPPSSQPTGSPAGEG